MTTLDRKLLRDLRLMWSQALTIALVVASGVGGFITSFSAFDSLSWSRDVYYAESRFAVSQRGNFSYLPSGRWHSFRG